MIRLLMLGHAAGSSKTPLGASTRPTWEDGPTVGIREGWASIFADALGVDFCRRGIWLERWACRPLSPPTCSTMRLASQTPIASNGSRLTASSPYALSSSPPSSPSWPSSPYCPP